RVSNPPPKPLLIWDGDCRFCELWIERWRIFSAGRLDDATSQQAATRLPEIPVEQFDRTIVFIDTNGTVFTGAEAVFRSLRFRRPYSWLTWAYDRVPGFAEVSEFGYGIIARNRRTSSAITRFCWGRHVHPGSYLWAQQ